MTIAPDNHGIREHVTVFLIFFEPFLPKGGDNYLRYAELEIKANCSVTGISANFDRDICRFGCHASQGFARQYFERVCHLPTTYCCYPQK